MHIKEIAMKNIEKIKGYRTKEVTEIIQMLKKVLPTPYGELLDNFQDLTVNQQIYILETMKNIKKYDL